MRLLARARLAYALLKDYEAEQEPISAAERAALIERYAEAVGSGRWAEHRRVVDVEAWRDAVERKAPLYPSSTDAPL